MSFFGDNDFSFLDTYRDKSNDEDESDDDRSQFYIGSSSSDGEDNEQDCTYIGVDSFDFEPPQSPVAPELRWRWRARKIVMGSHLLGKIQKQKSE